MATTIQSGRANSPLLTADVASRAEIFGGRGLVFDGVTDYLTCGTGLGNQLGNGYSKDTGLTASLWFKNDGTTDGGLFQIGNNGGAGEFSFQIDNNNDLYFLLNGNGWHRKIAFTDTSSWHHVVCVYGSSQDNSKIYLDGESVGTAGGSFPSTLDFNGLHTTIGSYWNLIYRFNGKITDVKVFNKELTEAQVTELYKKPENTPSAVQDNIVAWYPMSEGNPESPQSIVYDHSENKLGSEKITSNTASDWADFTSNGTEPVRTTTANGVSLKSQGDSRASYHTITGCTNGSLYKVVFNSRTDLSDGNVKIYFNASTTYFTPVISTTDTQYTIYGYAGSSNALQISGLDTGTTIFIENFSVKEVLMGNHATTNFFGDELFTDGDFEASGTTSWDDHVDSHEVTLAKDTGTVKSGSKSLKITRVSGKGGFAQAVTGLDTSKQYRYTGWVYSNSDNIALAYKNDSQIGISPTTLETITTTGQWVFFDHTFTPPASTTYIGGWKSVDDSFAFLDDFSLKEVGISSSGFLPVTNEPIIPQIPLVRYNEKMLFDGVDDKVTLGSTLTIASAGGQGSVSAVVNISQIDSNYRMIFGGTHPNLFAYMGYYSNNFKWLIDGAWNTSSTQIVAGKTYHIVGTWNNTSYKFYVNGVLDWSITDSGVLADFNTIGDSPNYEEHHGIIDEVSTWNVELTSTQVQELFADSVIKDATTHSKKGNLLGYWRNDGVSKWQDRRGWSYLDFNGSSNEVTLDSELTFTGVFSVSFWVKHNSSGAEYVIGKSSGDQDFFYAHPTNPRWKINNVIASSNTAMAVGVWHHVLGVRNSSNVLKWYLNGSAGALWTGSAYLTTGVTRSGDFDINYFGRSSSNYGEIELANVAFFNTDKSSSASTFYNNGLSYDYTTESGITNYYKMDSDSTLLDRVGSVNGTVDATLNDGNTGNVQGSPDAITIREGLDSNKDGLGFPLKNLSSNVLRLNGSSEYVNLSDNLSSFVNESTATISAWIKPMQTANYKAIFTYGDTNGNTFIHFQLTDAEILTCGVRSVGSDKWVLNTDSAIQTEAWTHVAITQNGTSPILYVNGEAVNQTFSVTTDKTVWANNLTGIDNVHIGFSSYNNNLINYWDGLLDEIKVYNRALSLSEIQKNYKHGKGKHKND